MGYAEFKNGLNKRAGIYIDNFVRRPAGNVMLGAALGLPVATVVDTGGEIAASVKENENTAGSPDGVARIVPGMSSHNITQLRKKNLRAAGASDPNALSASELFGSAISIPLATLACGILGAGAGAIGGGIAGGAEGAKEGAAGGGIIGSIAGAVTPIVGSRLMAALTKTRTPEEHVAYASDTGSVAGNLLIPGLSTYNYYKTLGRIHADQVEAEKAAAKENKNKA